MVDILNETKSGKAITFKSGNLPNIDIDRIAEKIYEITTLSKDYQPSTDWERFKTFTSLAMSKKLADFLDENAKKH